MKTFCFKWGAGLGFYIVLAWCHLLIPLPAKAVNGSSTSTSNATSSMQGLPKEKQRGQGQGPSSTAQRLPIEKHQPRPRVGSSLQPSPLSSPLPHSSSFSGAPVVHHTPFQKAKGVINKMFCLDVSALSPKDMKNMIDEAGKKKTRKAAKENSVYMKKSLVNHRHVFQRFSITATDLTNCGLNPFSEMWVLDPALQDYCDKYRHVNSSYCFSKKQISHFQEESSALIALLRSDFKKADSDFNRVKHSTLFPFIENDDLHSTLFSFGENRNLQDKKFPPNWENAWYTCFAQVKRQTAEQIVVLSSRFTKDLPFYGSLQAFSEVPAYLWDQNAVIYKAFKLYWRPEFAIDQTSSDEALKQAISYAILEATSNISENTLISYYDSKNPGQPSYREALETFQKSLDGTSQKGLQQVKKTSRIIQGMPSERRVDRFITRERLAYLRLQNQELYEVVASIPHFDQEPRDEVYLGL